MMKNSLGKIRYIISLLFLPLVINAQVILKAPDTFYQGDNVFFSITALGSEVKMPDINTIDGIIVKPNGTSQQTTIINGKRSYQIVKKYVLKATKNINIPAFEILVDNKVEKTKPKKIKLLKVEKTKSDLYDLTISTNSSDVYIGEAVEFTVKFKYKKDLDIVGLNYNKPDFENFWVKELKPQEKQNNFTQYVEHEIKYLLFPQKAGVIELPSVRIGVETVKKGYNQGLYFTTPTTSTPVYSNKLQLKVKQLPKDINLIGDFEIKATIDKSVIKYGEAISYKLYIEGRGNIDDLDEVSLKIPQTAIYDNPAKKEFNITNNLYGGSYSKNYSIIGKKDFTIPSIQIKYFDKKTNTVKTIQTQSFDIKVKGDQSNSKKLEVQSDKIEQKEPKILEKRTVIVNTQEKLLYFVAGLSFGIILILVIIGLSKIRKTKPESTLISLVKKSKNSNELFKLLVIYINIDEELDKIIYKLENVSNTEFKREKKHILTLLKELNKKEIKLDL